jgi:hypothetical protein
MIISPDSWQRLANEGTIVVSPVNVSLENPPPLSRMGSGFSRATSPTSFSAQLLSQDQELLPLRDITTEEQNKANQANPIKKTKRTRLLLDARTELTDDELRVRFMRFMLILSLFDVFFPGCSSEIPRVSEYNQTRDTNQKTREKQRETN